MTTQIIEGLDNEVTFVFFFLTILLAVVIPLYVLKPNRNNQQNSETQETQDDNSSQNTSSTDNQTSPNNTQNSTESRNYSHEDVSMENRPPDQSTEPVSASFPSEEADSGPPTVSSTNQSEPSQSNDEQITLKIMHHENSQQVTVSKNMQLKDLKKKCFPSEYEAGQTIRMIYSGKLLSGDTYPLRYLGIMNGCVLHSVISNLTQDEQGRTNEPASVTDDLDLSGYFFPLLVTMVFASWSFVFGYSSFFSATSITILGFLTVLFLGITMYS